ncbi:hypothetical protein [Nocardia sp. NPDC006630]|uniref:hypothetical protein n=1 Tax=Nocardia sp. NPDC006630 TaxID=3157181 RepID=UPI0033B4404B
MKDTAYMHDESARDGLPGGVDSATGEFERAVPSRPVHVSDIPGLTPSNDAPGAVQNGSPDIDFTLSRGSAQPAPEAIEPTKDLSQRVIAELVELIAPDWQRLDAVFAMTVSDEAAQIVVSDDRRTARVLPPAELVARLRELRHLSAESGDGPWWRVLVSLSDAGDVQVDYDYGAEPFPDDQLLPPQAYLADLQVYPRKRLPVWLAAYVGHNGSQGRSPRTAVAQVQADRAAEVQAAPVTKGLPPFPLLWARWAVISAAFVAAKSPWGPRITTALGWFEGSSRSGSTLHRFPGDRAVLSGGLWNAPELDAVYNDGAPMPSFYRGAPEWVADPVVNPRAANGLLSFCFWWDGTGWHQGESPEVAGLGAALPGIWTSESSVDVIIRVLAASQRSAITELVAAAEAGTVTRSLLTRSLEGERVDVDSAYYQLMSAGVVAQAVRQPL